MEGPGLKQRSVRFSIAFIYGDRIFGPPWLESTGEDYKTSEEASFRRPTEQSSAWVTILSL